MAIEMVNAWVETATVPIQSLTAKVSVATVALIAERTIGEGNVRLALRIQGGSGAVICIHGITIVTAGICIHGITTEIKDICTPGLTMGITGTGKIGKLFVLSKRLKGQNRMTGGSNES